MKLRSSRWVPAMVAIFATTGCASAGGGQGDQVRNTVFATHRMVQKLDTNLSSTVEQLNRTSAELAARVEASDRETRRLVSMMEENQMKLDQLQRRLDELTATLYRQFNLSPPANLGAETSRDIPPTEVERTEQRSDIESRGVVVEPPVETAPPERVDLAAAPPATGPSEDEAYIRARELYANEQYQSALQAFDAFLRMYPTSANAGNAQYWKAYCHFKLEDFAAYIREADTLRAKYPDSVKVPIAIHNQAVAYSRLGQNDRAEEAFRELIEAFPDDVVTETAREQLRKLEEMKAQN